MARVIERFVRARPLADMRRDPWLQSAAHWLVRGPETAETNWGVLDFAATVCKVRKPLCVLCPLRGFNTPIWRIQRVEFAQTIDAIGKGPCATLAGTLAGIANFVGVKIL